ncbi:MAG: biotin/lipoyl-binding protein [Planctomycetota bacterium]|nr:MAG: biotin/lipoyl-binding protein [Planctomycetota bacterium]
MGTPADHGTSMTRLSDTPSPEEIRRGALEAADAIDRLVGEDIPPERFFFEYLRRIGEVTGCVAAGCWLCHSGGQAVLVADVGLRKEHLLEEPQIAEAVQTATRRAISEKQPVIGSPTPPEARVAAVLAVPILHHSDALGVIVLLLPPGTSQPLRVSLAQYVTQTTRAAVEYLQRRGGQSDSASAPRGPELAQRLDTFSLHLHQRLSRRHVADVAAHEGVSLIGCDRLSVAVQQGKTTEILAMSDRQTVDPREPLVATLREMANRIIRMREPLTYSGSAEGLPTQIEQPLKDFVAASGSKWVHVVPLFQPEPLVDPHDEDARVKPREPKRIPIGGLIVERFHEARPTPQMSDRIELVADHVTVALADALAHERVPALPLWRGIGNLLARLEGRTALKAAVITLALTATLVGLAFVPCEYRVHATGRLLPTGQRGVFAPRDGRIVEVFVRDDQRVRQGDPLLRLFDPELEAEFVEETFTLETEQKLLDALRAQAAEATSLGTPEDVVQIDARIKEAELRIEASRERLQRLSEQRDALLVRAPCDGVVGTIRVDQRLRLRPVRRGELLLEIFQTDGEWYLELDVPEHRIGHVYRAQQRLRTPRLPVEYRLATTTTDTYEAYVSESATRADASPTVGGIVLLTARPRRMPDLPPRIGAALDAKICCGDRTLFYVLFGDLIEFLEKQFWL